MITHLTNIICILFWGYISVGTALLFATIMVLFMYRKENRTKFDETPEYHNLFNGNFVFLCAGCAVMSFIAWPYVLYISLRK